MIKKKRIMREISNLDAIGWNEEQERRRGDKDHLLVSILDLIIIFMLLLKRSFKLMQHI